MFLDFCRGKLDDWLPRLHNTAKCMMTAQVQEPPSWIIKPSDLRGAELDKVEFKCEALGSPPPKYTWVDKDGLDATEKEGKNQSVCLFALT